jgi:LTXXQ motif family protein
VLKPALCAAALVVAAAVAIPAIAQQSPQADTPSANSPGPQAGPDGRGPGWRGSRDRYSDEDAPRGRRWEGRRYGRDGDDDDGPRRWHGPRFGGRDGMMPPMMERDAMVRPFGMGHFCGPDGGRMGEFMINRVERATQPTAEQREGFDKLKEAFGKASETMRGACTTERPVTPTGRLAAAEKRLAAMLDAVRTVRPALDAYYGTLTDEQKARLTLAQPHMGRPGMGGGWRERMNRWRERMHDGRPNDRTENTQQSPSGSS